MENFSSVLRLAKENKGKAIAAEPFVVKGFFVVYSPNDPVIDFAIV